ncbi:MAG: hypothetical protein ACR2FO_05120 [Actinomycetota bacterium]
MVAVLVIASGCTSGYVVPSGLESDGDFSRFNPSGPGVACRLLAAEEVELALNSKVGNALTVGIRPILSGMEMCFVNASTNETVSWGTLSNAAAGRFSDYERINKRYVETLDLEGHRALWDGELRILLVLKQRKAFAVQMAGEGRDLGKAVKAQEYRKETAKLLAVRALRRL